MRSVREVLALSKRYLEDRAVQSAQRMAEELVAHVLGKGRIELYMDLEFPLEATELESLRELLKRAGLHEPLEYVFGSMIFYGCDLVVTSDVLIPRQETEILIDKALELTDPSEGKVVLDLCCGSGCIGLSLKKRCPLWDVYLCDASEKALEICRQNKMRNGLEVTELLGDFLTPFEGRKADYVFCNPPYVSLEEYEALDPSVKSYEPKMALVAGVDGADFYRRLARELPGYLNPGAKIFLEIGASQGFLMKEIFSSAFWRKKELIVDFAGQDRFFFLEIE